MIAAAAALVLAATPPSPAGPNVSPTVVVTAEPGPAFWKVSKGDSVVWVLGVPPVVPKRLKWSTHRLDRLLDGAQALLTEAAYAVSARSRPFEGRSAPLEQTLPPDLRGRFVAAREHAGQGAARYADQSPLAAGYRLRADLYARAGLTQDEPDRTIRAVARRRRVPIRPVAVYRDDGDPVLEAVSGEAQQACLEGAIADAGFALAHAPAAAKAWAVGDLATVRDNLAEPRIAQCLDASPAFAGLQARRTADTTAAIEAALSRPGRTVVIDQIEPLLKSGGVLDRLRADGAEITVPPE